LSAASQALLLLPSHRVRSLSSNFPSSQRIEQAPTAGRRQAMQCPQTAHGALLIYILKKKCSYVLSAAPQPPRKTESGKAPGLFSGPLAFPGPFPRAPGILWAFSPGPPGPRFPRPGPSRAPSGPPPRALRPGLPIFVINCGDFRHMGPAITTVGLVPYV
jgi:hypothetical protein